MTLGNGAVVPWHRLKRLLGDTAVYGLSGAVGRLFALITFPLLARQLSVEDYGAVDLFLYVANWCALCLICGFDSAIARLLQDHLDDGVGAQLVSQGLLLVGILAIVGVPLLWLLAEPLAARLHNRSDGALLLRLVALQLPFIVLVAMAQGVMRWTFQRRRFVVLSLGSAAANALLLIVVLRRPGAEPADVFRAALAVQVVFAAVGLHFLRPWLTLPRNLRHAPSLAAFAVPVGITSIIGAAVPLIERSMVLTWSGQDTLGIYAAGAKVASLLALALYAFQSGWTPFAVALHRQPDAAATYNLALRAYAVCASLAVLALAAFGPWLLVLLTGERYRPGAVVIFPLAMALAVQGAAWIFELGITVSRRTYLSLIASLGFVGAFVLMSWVLGPVLGWLGVAFALLAAQVVYLSATIRLAQRAHPIDWQWRGPLAAFAAVSLLAVSYPAAVRTMGLGAASACLAVLTLLGLIFITLRILASLPRAGVNAARSER